MTALVRTLDRTSIALGALAALVPAILLVAQGNTAESRGTPVGSGDDGVELVSIGDFESPVHVAFAPGDADNVYVVEQRGTVQVIDGGVEQPAHFLDIQDLTEGSGEQGLLSIAFDPAYPATPTVYAYYTDEDNGDIVVSAFDATDPLGADENSRVQVIRIRHRANSNHNGGQLQFGPDGHLYLGTGDGGGANDLRENAQNKNSLLGKLLRIDPLPGGGHSSAAGNPYVGRPGRDEIYALGLRNPFRFSFDAQTDRILIGDVGQDRFEEVDYETPETLRNANFGWDRYEGFRRNHDDVAATPKRKRHAKPILAYGHGRDGFSCSVIGGYVVRDPDLDTLFGRYLYADNCGGKLWSLVPKLTEAQDDHRVGVDVDSPASFGEDPVTKEVYVASLDGPVYRLEPGM